MIEKFLTRFCAPEVRTMVIRLHERPDDFGYGSRWRDLAEARQGLTWVERKVLDKEWIKFKKNRTRRELLNLITNEVINPTPRDRWGHSLTQKAYEQLYDQADQQRNAYAQQAQYRLSENYK